MFKNAKICSFFTEKIDSFEVSRNQLITLAPTLLSAADAPDLNHYAQYDRNTIEAELLFYSNVRFFLPRAAAAVYPVRYANMRARIAMQCVRIAPFERNSKSVSRLDT